MEETKRLTEEQRKLVEDNYGLVIWWINKYGLKENEVNDWYGIAAESLCVAALKYDEAKGVPFGTFASSVISNRLKSEFRSGKGKVKTVPEEAGEAVTCYDFREVVEGIDLLERSVKGMTDKTKDILIMVSEGYSTDEISEELQVTHSQIHNAKLRLKRKLQREKMKAER